MEFDSALLLDVTWQTSERMPVFQKPWLLSSTVTSRRIVFFCRIFWRASCQTTRPVNYWSAWTRASWDDSPSTQTHSCRRAGSSCFPPVSMTDCHMQHTATLHGTRYKHGRTLRFNHDVTHLPSPLHQQSFSKSTNCCSALSRTVWVHF